MSGKKASTGFRIKRSAPGLPPRELRVRLPGELVRAIDAAAAANGVDAAEVVRVAMSRVLRVELKAVGADPGGPAEKGA